MTWISAASPYSVDEDSLLAVWVAAALVCAIIGALIGNTKGDALTGAILGGLLGLIGVLIIALMRDQRPAQQAYAARQAGQPPATPAGWNPDPYHRHELRFFDGLNWRANVSDDGVMTFDDVAAVPPPPQPSQMASAVLPRVAPLEPDSASPAVGEQVPHSAAVPPRRGRRWLAPVGIGAAVIFSLGIVTAVVLLDSQAQPGSFTIETTVKIYQAGSFSMVGDAGCTGGGDFSDLHEGTRVTVSSNSGRGLAGGTLGPGAFEISAAGGVCSFPIRIEGIPPEAGYTVKIDDRTGIDYTRAELQSALTLATGSRLQLDGS